MFVKLVDDANNSVAKTNLKLVDVAKALKAIADDVSTDESTRTKLVTQIGRLLDLIEQNNDAVRTLTDAVRS